MNHEQAELIVKRIVVVGHMLDELTLVVQALPTEDFSTFTPPPPTTACVIAACLGKA